jgi:single stranded DNA-binding protein
VRRCVRRNATVTQFSIATNDYRSGSEKSEFHPIVTWDRLAEICGEYLGKGALVCIEGRIQTRQWEDDSKQRHWKTEIVASAVEMLSGKRKKDYAAESAAEALALQATAMGFAPQHSSYAGAQQPAGANELGAELDATDDGLEDEDVEEEANAALAAA